MKYCIEEIKTRGTAQTAPSVYTCFANSRHANYDNGSILVPLEA